MATQPITSIPVIDLSPNILEPGTDSWVLTMENVRQAMEQIGCFQVIYHKGPSSEIIHNNIVAAVEELFKLPIEIKSKKLSHKPYFNYFGHHHDYPLIESLAADHPDTLHGCSSFTHAMWPSGNDQFCERSLEFAKVLVEIDQLVMKLLSESYGVEDRYYYKEYLGATNYVLRYFKYNAPKEDETNVGLSPHIDKSMFTILHQNHVDGLQIKTKDDVWIDAQLNSPTSFIVFAGNGLTAWSNDRIPGCWHQVIMKEGKETRYTIGLGSIASGTVPISQAMADESRPLMYKPFDHFGYLRFCEASRDVTPEGLLQAYAGVNLSSSVVN